MKRSFSFATGQERYLGGTGGLSRPLPPRRGICDLSSASAQNIY